MIPARFAAFVLLFLLLPAVFAAPSRRKARASLQGKLAGVTRRIRAVRTELRQAKRSEAAIAAELEEIRGRLQRTRAQLRQSRSRLAKTRAIQQQVAGYLARSQRRLKEREFSLARRMAANYRQGPVRYASVLLGARSMGALVSRAQFVRSIVRYESTLIAQIKAEREAVVRWKREVDRRAGEAEAIQKELMQRHADELEDVLRQRAVLAEAKTRRAEIEDDLAALEEDSEAIAARLRALEATVEGRARSLVRFTGRFVRPAGGGIVSGFGMRFHPILHRSRMHTGVDIGAGHGAPIYAAAAGVVVFAGSMRGYGNVVVVDHGGGISTLYAHCSALLVSDGQSVSQGQTIARVGATGLATGPHLHFEVRRNGSPVDPMGAL